MGLVDGSMEYVDDVSSVGIDLSSTVKSSPSSILDNIVDIVLHLLQNEIKRKPASYFEFRVYTSKTRETICTSFPLRQGK